MTSVLFAVARSPQKAKELYKLDLHSHSHWEYAKIALRSGLAVKKFIAVGEGVIDNDYRGEIGVVLFNHSAVDFLVQVGDRIAQLILETIKTPAVQKVIALSAIDRCSGGLGSTGLQSSGSSNSVIQKENRAKKSEKVQKERMLEGSKEKITPSSHTAGSVGRSRAYFWRN